MEAIMPSAHGINSEFPLSERAAEIYSGNNTQSVLKENTNNE